MAPTRKLKPRSNTKRPRRKKVTAQRPGFGRSHAYLKPPKGYVMVPKGDVYVTRKCTVLTQDVGKEVHVVHNQKGTRIGLHVPRKVWERVRDEAARTAEKRREAVRRKDERDRGKAEAELRKHYPRIPLPDLKKVLGHAFLKGSGRVGRTSGQSIARRASLAVGAHIRHTYTDYDFLLRDGIGREQARDMVRKRVKEFKLAWTG